jgi:hypothetical protein
VEIIAILRVLRRHRILTALGIVPAVLAGLAVLFHVALLPPKLERRATTVGSASARVLLGAQEQPTPHLEASMNDSLGTRALILADLMATDEARARIAGGAGLAEGEAVAVYGPSTAAPPVAIPLATKATEAAGLSPEPYRLTVSTDGRVPIITLRATGADAAGAAKIVEAAAGALEQLLPSGTARRPGLLLQRLGPAVGTAHTEQPKAPVAVFGALVVFVLWCAAVVLVSGVARYRRGRRVPRGVTRHPIPG